MLLKKNAVERLGLISVGSTIENVLLVRQLHVEIACYLHLTVFKCWWGKPRVSHIPFHCSLRNFHLMIKILCVILCDETHY